MRRLGPFYVLAAVVVVVGAEAFGLPTSSLWILGFVALCPLMMMFMMSGMHGGADRRGAGPSNGGGLPEDRDHRFWLEHRPLDKH